MRALLAILFCVLLGACAHLPADNVPAGVGKQSVKKIQQRRQATKPIRARETATTPSPSRWEHGRRRYWGYQRRAHHWEYRRYQPMSRVEQPARMPAGGSTAAAARDPLSPITATLQPVYYATNREITDGEKPLAERITYDRSMALKYGLAIVSVPRSHLIGNIERPRFNYFRWAYEPERDDKHFVMKPLVPMTREALIEGLKRKNDSILLFIHGYNTPFRDAIFKAAQIAYDANFPGSVLAFSWPSAGELLGYDYDTVSAGFSTSDLLDLMQLVTRDAGGKRVYVVAHSMGNQIVTNALVRAKLSNIELGISELVMAAPDVDKDTFFKVANDIKSVVPNVTMYASSVDKALLASEKKSWASRMGYIGASGPHLVDWIETIDVTAVGEDMLGLNHSKYSENRAVLEDLARIIMSKTHAKAFERNTTLRAMPDKDNVRYWRYAK